MAQEKKRFFGGMDFDTENRFVKEGDYRVAVNMKTSGENDALGVLENIVGSEFISNTATISFETNNSISKNNSITIPSVARVVGKYRDEVHDRIIYFIANGPSNSNTGSILEYSQKQNAISVIVDSYAFNFSFEELITGINVVAHDEPWAPDGLLYFTDNRNEPIKINIAKAKLISSVASAKLTNPNASNATYFSAHHQYGFSTTIESSNGYVTLTDQIIKVVKFPPVSPPGTKFGTDNTFLNNQLIQNQWQFKYRYVYDDKEKSAWSPISKTRTTAVGTSINQEDLTIDNFLELEFNSGTKEVRFIEFAARKKNNNTDFFLIDSIPTYYFSNTTTDKNKYVYNGTWTGSPSNVHVTTVNTDFYYRFFNNKTYSNIDLKQSVKPFDDVPLKAKSQEIIDGNRLVYGNVENGRDGVATNVAIMDFYKGSEVVGQGDVVITSSIPASSGSGLLQNHNGQNRVMQRFHIDFDFSAAVSGGILAADTSVSMVVKSFGFFAGAFRGDTTSGSVSGTGCSIAGALEFQSYLTNIPAGTSENNFYTYIKNQLTSDYPTVDTILPGSFGVNPNWSGYGMGSSPWSVVSGDNNSNWNAWSPGSSGSNVQQALNSGDGVLWKVITNGVRLQFGVTTNDTFGGFTNAQFAALGINFEDFPLASTFLNSTGSLTSGYFPLNPTTIPGYAQGQETIWNRQSGHVFNETQTILGNCWNDLGGNSGHLYNNGKQLLQLGLETFALPSQNTGPMGFKSNTYHSFGIVYYDDANRSSAVCPIHEDKFIPANADRATNITFHAAHLKFEIKHSPPSWATGWQLVYSGNRNVEDSWRYRILKVEDTGSKFVMDVTTISDTFSEGGQTSKEYDFAEDDRVLFIEHDGTLLSSSANFKILSVEPGGSSNYRFIIDNKISLIGPGTAEFFEDALVEVFRPRKDVDDDDVFYYEIGERHPIVFDSGDSEYYHNVSEATSYTDLNLSDGTANQTVTNANQTAIDTAGSGAILFIDRGDVYHRLRPTFGSTVLDYVEDFQASDYFSSKNWDSGRTNVINPQYRQTVRPSTVFYSDPLIANTNINGLSSIFPDDTYEEFDKSYGSIQKLHSRENQLIIFQEDKVSRAQVNRDIVTTGSGDQILTAQGAVISQAIPYAGEYGISTNPESFAEYAEVLYFTDLRRGAVLRLSQNGITPISEYQMKNYFTDFFRILSRYDLTDNARRRTKIYGSFNPKDKEYMLCLDRFDAYTIFEQSHTHGSDNLLNEAREGAYFDNFGIRNTFSSNTQAQSITDLKRKELAKRTVVFSEGANRWTYFMDIHGMCEYLNSEVVHFSPTMSSASNACPLGGTHSGGLLYVLRREDFDTSFNPENYGEFYSQSTSTTEPSTNGKNIVTSSVINVSNTEPSLNKVYNAIGLECNETPLLFEIQNNYRQYSKIFTSYWKERENFYYSNIYGDINSFSAFDSTNQLAGMINGERIRSTDATMRTSWRTNTYLRLHAINVGLTASQKSGVV